MNEDTSSAEIIDQLEALLAEAEAEALDEQRGVGSPNGNRVNAIVREKLKLEDDLVAANSIEPGADRDAAIARAYVDAEKRACDRSIQTQRRRTTRKKADLARRGLDWNSDEQPTPQSTRGLAGLLEGRSATGRARRGTRETAESLGKDLAFDADREMRTTRRMAVLVQCLGAETAQKVLNAPIFQHSKGRHVESGVQCGGDYELKSLVRLLSTPEFKQYGMRIVDEILLGTLVKKEGPAATLRRLQKAPGPKGKQSVGQGAGRMAKQVAKMVELLHASEADEETLRLLEAAGYCLDRVGDRLNPRRRTAEGNDD